MSSDIYICQVSLLYFYVCVCVFTHNKSDNIKKLSLIYFKIFWLYIYIYLKDCLFFRNTCWTVLQYFDILVSGSWVRIIGMGKGGSGWGRGFGNEIRLNMNLIVLKLVEECLGLQYLLLFTFVYGFTFLRCLTWKTKSSIYASLITALQWGNILSIRDHKSQCIKSRIAYW